SEAIEISNKCRMSFSLLLSLWRTTDLRLCASFLLQVSVNQFFRVFHTLEFVELRALLFTAVDNPVDLPGPRVDGFILDGRFVVDVIGVGQSETLDDVRVFSLEIP